jgi:hypothetical protein
LFHFPLQLVLNMLRVLKIAETPPTSSATSFLAYVVQMAGTTSIIPRNSPHTNKAARRPAKSTGPRASLTAKSFDTPTAGRSPAVELESNLANPGPGGRAPLVLQLARSDPIHRPASARSAGRFLTTHVGWAEKPAHPTVPRRQDLIHFLVWITMLPPPIA